VLIFGVFALGAICMLLGFFTVVRGIGASDSEATVKMLGVEFHASKLGPGLVFSVLGLILVVVAVSVEKGGGDKPGATLASGPAPAPAAAPTSTNATPSGQPTQAVAPAAVSVPPAQPVDNAKPVSMSYEDVGVLIQDTLSKIALGYCPAENLEPLTLSQCQQNAAIMQQAFALAGPIRGVTYYGKAATPMGEVDQYVVTFQNSGPVIWKAAVTPNRKFAGLWTGPP
jgi:hypothetical protein